MAFTNNCDAKAAGGNLALSAAGGGNSGAACNPSSLSGDAWLAPPPRGVQAILGGKSGAVSVVVGTLGPEVASRCVWLRAPRAGGGE